MQTRRDVEMSNTVRNLLNNGHAYLRTLVRQVEHARDDERWFRDCVLSLCEAVLGHMAVEESILRPVLVKSGADERLRVLDEEHEAQRIRVKLLDRAARDASRPLGDLHESVDGFLDALRAEMAAEERDFL